MPNREQLLTTLTFLHDNPEQWSQGAWGMQVLDDNEDEANVGCGTALCMAGANVVLNGYSLKWEAQRRMVEGKDGNARPVTIFFASHTTTGALISDLAGELLDLPWMEEVEEYDFYDEEDDDYEPEVYHYRDDMIFGGGNNLRDLYEQANRMLVEDNQAPIEIPDDVDTIGTVEQPRIDWTATTAQHA